MRTPDKSYVIYPNCQLLLRRELYAWTESKMQARAHTRRDKERGGREILRQRSPTELLAFCTASCVICSREFIVLYLDLYSCRRGFVDAGLAEVGKKNYSIFMAR